MERCVDCALAALGRLLSHFGMVDHGDLVQVGLGTKPSKLDRGLATRQWSHYQRRRFGCSCCTIGSILREGDAIAKIVNAQGITRETVCAKQTCVVLAYPDKAWMRDGYLICTIGVLET